MKCPSISGQVFHVIPAFEPATSAPSAICNKVNSNKITPSRLIVRGAPSSAFGANRVATITSSVKITAAVVRCSISLIGATATMPSLSPDATMIQPIIACTPPNAPIPSTPNARRPLSAPSQSDVTKPAANTSPMRRPNCRCDHSHQKIVWNSPKLIPLFSNSYCGIA